MTTVNRTPIRETVQSYIDSGLQVVPLKGKDAYITGWQERTFGPEDFAEIDNVGVKLGPPSGDLLDVDLDHELAVKLAKHFLPKGATIFGRASNPSSHWLYVADPGVEGSFRKQFRDPDTRELFLEIRGNHHQTMFPGSIHPDDELVEWESEHAPPAVTYETLETSARYLAAATYLVLHWPDWKTQHHDLILPMAGMTAMAGIDRKRTSDFLSVVTVVALDVEPHKRQQIIDSTYDRVGEGEPVSGRKALAEIIGTKSARWLSKMLGCDSQPDTALKYGMSDVGNSDRLVARNRDTLRYCPDLSAWFLFNGRYWAKDETGAVIELAKESAREIPDEGKGLPPNEHALLMKWGASSLSAARIKAAVELAKSDPDLTIRQSEFDTNRYVLNVANGTLNLETGGLMPHDANDLHSKIVEIPADRHAKCPLWLSHLERVLPDPEMRAYFQRWVGYMLTGLTKEKAFLIVDGPTGTGKTTTVNVIRKLLGDFANVVDESAFGTSANREAKAHDLVPLVGRRLVVWSESGKRMTLNEARIKSITGGNSSVIRYHYKEHQTVDLIAKVLIETNDPPKISATDDAVWARAKRIPFLVPFSETDRRLSYEDGLFRELPGILNWGVDGSIEFLRIGLAEPESAKKAARALREHQSDVFGFVEDECIFDASKSTLTADLYAAFKRYSDAIGNRFPISRRSFTEQISKLPGVEIRLGTAGNRSIVGLALRPGAGVFAVPIAFDRSKSGKTDVG